MPSRDDCSQHAFVMLEKIIEPQFAFGLFGRRFPIVRRRQSRAYAARSLGQTSRSGASWNTSLAPMMSCGAQPFFSRICLTASNIRTTPAREFTSVTAIARYPCSRGLERKLVRVRRAAEE